MGTLFTKTREEEEAAGGMEGAASGEERWPESKRSVAGERMRKKWGKALRRRPGSTPNKSAVFFSQSE